MVTAVTTPLTTVSVQSIALAQSMVSEFAFRVVPVAALSWLEVLVFVVLAPDVLVTTFMLWVTSQPAEVVSGRTVGGAMTVGV
jgi:hypothetical protein